MPPRISGKAIRSFTGSSGFRFFPIFASPEKAGTLFLGAGFSSAQTGGSALFLAFGADLDPAAGYPANDFNEKPIWGGSTGCISLTEMGV